MPGIAVDLERLYEDFLESSGEAFAKERLKKKQEMPDLFGEEKVREMKEGEVREIVRNLWAFEGWSNKDYLVDQMLEDGIEEFRSHLYTALYEYEEVETKFDELNENVNMLGPASITEIFTFLYPDRCAIYNRRAKEAMQHLGYEVPDRLTSGTEYEAFLEQVVDLKSRLEGLEAEQTKSNIEDFVDVDYFLFYVSNLETDEEESEEPIEDFDHEEFKQKLLEIGDGLGFDVEEEYEAGPGARLDVRWRTRVANLGVIAYAFEVHRSGSRDSALTNLMKAQTADPTLQKLVVVSTEEEIGKFRAEAAAISPSLEKSISFFEVGQVEKAEVALEELREILQDAELMVDL